MNPIILLHGALGSSDQLLHLVNALEKTERKVFTMNFSGHGGQPYSENGFGIETFAEELIELLNKNSITKTDLFGYSMGGYVALWAATIESHRFGKITTLGTKFDWSPQSAEKEIGKMNADKIQEKIPAFARLLHHRHFPNDWKDLLRRTSEMMFDLGQRPLLDKNVLSKIELPVKILLGDQDDMADLSFSRQVAAWLPFGKFELLENVPHPIEKVKTEILLQKINGN